MGSDPVTGRGDRLIVPFQTILATVLGMGQHLKGNLIEFSQTLAGQSSIDQSPWNST